MSFFPRGRLAALCLAPLLCAAPVASAASAEDLLKGVKAPPGFEVTLFAAPPQISYPVCLAATANGDLFVGVDENGSLDAKANRGRIIRCSDRDGDGKADEFKTFAEMDSPRGIWFDRDTAYVVHPPFVTAFTDENGDGVSDRSRVLVKGLGFDLKFRGADHTVNGMRMGIDGFLYIAVGDYGAIKAEGADGASLQLHGGGIVRVRPDGAGLELVCDGLRNIYDVAVSPLLDLFTRDNTNDGGGWNVRLSHIIQGGHYGYPTLFKNFSDEIVAPLADYGGGSPCGALYLDEPGFPPVFGAALYTCDWGRSIVYRHPLIAAGAGFSAEQQTFVEIARPTDMDVDGSGRLYISSWKDGNFTFTGPNVGFVVRVTPTGQATNAPVNLAAASDEGLLRRLASASAVSRLESQREILRRSGRKELAGGVLRLLDLGQPLAVRVAALFTFKQLLGAEANPSLARMAHTDETLREFALRAIGDDRAGLKGLPAKPFFHFLTDPNARVRFQAAVLLGRLGNRDAAPNLLDVATETDPLIAHAAINSLFELRASSACFAALDSPTDAKRTAAAYRVLQALHEPEVVEGLIERLGRTSGSSERQSIHRALCRLYQREADWDGRWWGTRPDTTGPYFKPARWSESERIGSALRESLAGTQGEALRAFLLDLQRHRVDLPEATPLLLKLAGEDEQFKTLAVEMLGSRANPPEEALTLFASVAVAPDASPSLRAKAIRALQRSSGQPTALKAAVAGLVAAGENPRDELNQAWEEFARDGRHQRNMEFFSELATHESPLERTLAFAVLGSLATQRNISPEARSAASQVIDRAWSQAESAVPLLRAIAKLRFDSFSLQVRGLMSDKRPEVAQAAQKAAEALGLDKGPREQNRAVIEKLAYEQALEVAANAKGDVRAGSRVFVRAGCSACHTVSSDEAPKGPFLGGITTRYNFAELCESILKPGAKIAQGFETQWFSTRDDEEFEGFVTRESGDDLDLRNIAGITTTLKKENIAQRGKRETSMMPAGLLDAFSPEDLASLLTYLRSLESK
jgi:putative heme-binding domain-containing protein